MFSFMKRPGYRTFDYEPRFYKEDEDPEVQRKKRLGFSQKTKFKKKKAGSFVSIMIVLALVLYFFIRFGG